MQRTQTLWVTNRNENPHSDRFDGEDFFFPYGEPVEVPIEGADLMFGYGQADKTSTLMRSGMAPTAKDLKNGLLWLANFTFSNAKPTEHQLALMLQGPAATDIPPEAAGTENAPQDNATPPAKPDKTIRPRVAA